MRRKSPMLIPTLVATFVAALFCTAGAGAAEAQFEIIAAEFGIFDSNTPDELTFEPTSVVPHRTGQRYGWIIDLRTNQRSLAVSEEYLLPTASTPEKAADPVSESLNIPQQRRSQVSQRQLVPVDGKIYGEWSVGPNEPAGHRRLQILIEGQLGASFEYDVK